MAVRSKKPNPGTNIAYPLKKHAFSHKRLPFYIYWKIVTGNRKLSVLEESDLIMDEYDLRIRKLI